MGALNDEDLRTLKSGYITLLPKDSNNRIMICYDASRLDTGNEESRLRCLVYMLHVASDGADSNVGINFLFVMNKLSFERTRHFSWLPQLLTILPTKIEVIHIVRQPARLGESVFRDKVVPTLQSLFQKTNTPLQTYSGTPDCDLRTLLKQSGLQVECLPQSLGGGWTYQDFQQWMNKRLLIERKSVMRLKETTNGETDHANVIRRPAETDLSIVRYVQSPSFAGDISLFPYGSCPQSSGSVGINSQLQAFLYQTQHTLPKHHLIQVHPTTSFLDYSSLQSFANRAQYDASCRAIFSVANKATAFHVPYSVTDGHSHPLQHRAQQVSPSTSSNNLQDRRSQAVESPRK